MLEMRSPLKSTAKSLLVAISVLFLLSMGAQFYAAPVLLPALWWASNSSRTWGAAGFTALAALLMTEVGWVVAYVAVGEDRPWIVVGPALGFATTIAFFVLTRHRAGAE